MRPKCRLGPSYNDGRMVVTSTMHPQRCVSQEVLSCPGFEPMSVMNGAAG